MKTIVGPFLFICFQAQPVWSQTNLVINPSFEDTFYCPVSFSDFQATKYWGETSGTPDYFHSCNANGIVKVPQNFTGYQNARTGNAYSGIICYLDTGTPNCSNIPNAREIIQGRFNSPLRPGKKYCVSFWVSLADSARYAINNLGAYISDTSYDNIDSPYLIFAMPFNRTPQIVNSGTTNPLTSKTNWIEISGIYTANGGEKYILIGNFNTDANNDTVNVGAQTVNYYLNMCYGNMTYYYIDDVSVYCCSADSCDDLANSVFVPSAFSPNEDGNNDTLFVRGQNVKDLHFTIYDRWGEMVFETNDISKGWDGKYKDEKLNNGVFTYYLEGTFTDGKVFSQKGDISLIR